ncbi:MAG: polysaccharide biosynthesis tyrosine autokinase [Flavobacteriales bacterium]|jgi:capsular exopolysaccharide synthesis family protein|nr:polysaccharide biosynthesis tyrosine autokinase [Flavobacteriales bacterium]
MEESNKNEFDLEVFLDIVKSSKIWFLTFFIITFAFAFLYIRYTPPVFESNLIIQIHKDNEANNVLNMYSQMGDQQDITSELELMKSKLLFKRTIKKLPLDVLYFTEGELLVDNKYKTSTFSISNYTLLDAYIIGKKIYVKKEGNEVHLFTEYGEKITEKSIKKDGAFTTKYLEGVLTIHNQSQFLNNQNNDKYYFVISDFEQLIDQLYRHLSIRVLNNNARTIQIAFQHNNKTLAKDIVSQIAEEYDAYSLEKKSSSYDNIVNFIEEQKESVEAKLKESERAIYNYKRNNDVKGVSNISNSYLKQLEEIENEIVKLQINLSILKEVKENIEKYKGSPDIYNLIPILIGQNFEPTLQNLVLKLKEKVDERELHLSKVTTKNKNIETLNNQIKLQVNLVLEAVKVSEENGIEKLNTLKSKLKNLDKELYSLPEKELELARLDRVLQINSKFYTLLLEKETEYKLSTAGLVTYNEILEQAKTPSSPIAPRKKSIYILAILVAIVLAITYTVIRYLLHDEITTLTDITNRLSSSVGILGIVPHYKSKIPVSQLIIHKNPKSLITEAFRSLRTNLEFITNKKDAKIVAVTSTISGEGKTFIALNLAGIIAFSGKRVIVLDLDMRKPKIHIGFGVENKSGMSTLLIGKDQIENCINKSELNGLDFITAGPIPPNPSELIINGEIDKILETLKEKYDTIIVDNPPVGLVTDGITIIKKADYPLYVFKANYSKKHFIENVGRIITDHKVTKLSVILNNVDTQKNTYGKGYGYGYTTYGGYYTEDNQTKGKFNRFFKKK